MLERIALRNFQKHKQLVIILDPKVTCIVGPTEAGKTTVIRALKLLALNIGSQRQIRHGTKSLAVRLDVNGHSVIRTRGGTGNVYLLDGKKFVSFNNSVPDEIAKVLNLDMANFQSQLDVPYWLLDTAGQVARNLNKIVNLDLIDSSLAFLASESRKAKTEEDVCEGLLKQAREDKNNLAWVRDFDRDVSELEHLYTLWVQNRTKRSQLTERLASVGRVAQTAKTARERHSDGSRVVLAGQRALAVAGKLEKLQKLIETCQSLKNLNRSTPDYTPVQRAYDRAQQVQQRELDLKNRIKKIKLAKERLCQAMSALKVSLKRVSKVMSTGKCPLCLRPMKL